MMISGLQKMTLLDFPGKVACTVFLQGCNFLCPFCHNSPLLGGIPSQIIPPENLLSFLRGRRGLLDGVCITGGEPTLQPDLPRLLESIKDLGYGVKLDTNGSRPEVLRDLVAAGLVDYVAMDVKNAPSLYGKTIGKEKSFLPAIEGSLRFLLSGAVDYELRTTVVAEFHNEKTMEEMGLWLASLAAPGKPGRLFLQYFVDREGVLLSGLNPPTEEQMAKFAEILKPFVEQIGIRG